jgi:hypothetical protein
MRATFEGVIVTQWLYESGGRNAKFRPVLFREEDERFIPLELRRFNRYQNPGLTIGDPFPLWTLH